MRISKSVREEIVRNIAGRGLGIGELIHLDMSYGKIRNFIMSKSIKRDILFMDNKTTPLVVIEEGGHVIPLKDGLSMSDIQSTIVFLATMGTKASLEELMQALAKHVFLNSHEHYSRVSVYHHGDTNIHVFLSDDDEVKPVSVYMNDGDDTRFVYNLVDNPGLSTLVGRTMPQGKGIVLGNAEELFKFAGRFFEEVI